MESQTEEKLAKCCFVITVGSNGHIEISSHKPDNVANTPEDGKHGDNSTLTDKALNQRLSIDVLKDFANGINDLQANQADDQELKTLRENKINVESQKTLVPPRFVKICNKDLTNRPSFVVLEDALSRNRVKQDIGHSRSEQLVPCDVQQQTSQSHISTHAGSQTDQYCAQKSVACNNNSTQKGINSRVDLAMSVLLSVCLSVCMKINVKNCQKIKKKSHSKLYTQIAAQVRQKLNSLNNKSTQLVPETRKKAGSSSFSQKQQQHQKLSEQIQQQHQLQTQNEHNQKLIEIQEELRKEAQQQHQTMQQLQQSFSNTSSHMSFGFLPMTQTGATTGRPMMYPGQQFLSSAPGNLSSCSCCSCSNCWSPRTPQVCQMPLSKCCSQAQNLGHGSNCSMLKPENYANCLCSGYASCCPLPNLQPHSSLAFDGHANSIHQYTQHLMPPVMGTSTSTLQNQQLNIPIATGFYSGCPCQPLCTCHQSSHFRMQAHQQYCCHYPWFFNNQQMYQSQLQQQQLQQQQLQQQQLQQQQLQQQQLQQQQLQQQHLQQQQQQCVCCPINLNKRRQNLSKGADDEVKEIFSKKPAEIPKQENKQQAVELNNQPISKKSHKIQNRLIGGSAHIKRNSNISPLYIARFGRSCLVLRPTALMPRLLTKRITSYSLNRDTT